MSSESEIENEKNIKSKDIIDINEEEDEEEEENNELEDTFSQDKETNKEQIEKEDIDSDDKSEEENSNNDMDYQEEQLLKDEIENVDFKSLLKAKAKLSYENSKKEKGHIDKKKFNKNSILNQMEKINKEKKRTEPKEYSALIKPNIQFKNRNKAKDNSSLLNKKFSRDPRFDDLSGNLNEEQFKKNFSFVNDMAKEYVDKLQKIKKSKKYNKKLYNEKYELFKKQNNYIKSWINQQKQKQMKTDIKKEINKENKERYAKGQKPIFINNNKLNKYIKNKKNE